MYFMTHMNHMNISKEMFELNKFYCTLCTALFHYFKLQFLNIHVYVFYVDFCYLTKIKFLKYFVHHVDMQIQN